MNFTRKELTHLTKNFFRSIFSASFLTVLTVLLLSNCSHAASSNKNSPETTYGVIVDCGSSGTRAHIYEWDTSLDFPDLLNKIEPMRDDKSKDGKAVSMKITPGLSSLKNNPSAASDYMKPIVDFIYEKVPKRSYKSTSIYMMATAGMRLLDEPTQLKILGDIANDLKGKHEFAKVKISVISGSAEGMYQWITVNSKLRRFAPKETDTVGVIEMGGSSIQVTYQLKPKTFSLVIDRLKGSPEAKIAFTNQIVEPELSREAVGYPYKLVSATFLGLGSNSARDAYVDLLIHHKLNRHHWFNQFFFKKRPFLSEESPQLVLKDPCLPTGATEKVERPTKMLDSDQSSGQTVGFNIEAGDETFVVTIQGESNYALCRLQLADLLSRAKNEKLNCKPGQACSMSLLKSKFIPYDHEEFIGLSELYYTTNEMLNISGIYDRTLMIRKGFEVCSKNFDALKSEFSKLFSEDPDRVREECFKAVWIETFLADGLKMPFNYKKLLTVGKINSDDIDWTLGAVLDNSLAIERAAEASD